MILAETIGEKFVNFSALVYKKEELSTKSPAQPQSKFEVVTSHKGQLLGDGNRAIFNVSAQPFSTNLGFIGF